jgi:hydrogenase/urease accessory protein HupE
MIARTASTAAAILLTLGAGAVWGHDARPLSIAIVEQANDVYRAVVRTPPTVEDQNTPRIVWPRPCRVLEATSPRVVPSAAMLVSCPGGLASRQIRIEYPFYNPSITSLIRLQTASGTPITAVLPPDELEWTVPAEPTFASVARDYLVLGFRHIWGGPDHLLFVAGLMLLARRRRRIVLAITGFTVAHSITLSVAALGLFRLPVAPVEAMIALSILFLAAEIARGDTASFSHRYPIALSFVFGLLHGFGFASALGEIGLPRNELATGLLFFNVGVEIGQLAFIAAIAVVLAGVRRLPAMSVLTAKARTSGAVTAGYERFSLAGAYCLGIPAAFWFLERSFVAFAA